MTWRPLSLRDKADARFDEPNEGIPSWLRGPMLAWVKSSFVDSGYGGGVNATALNQLQLALRLERPFTGSPYDRIEDLLGRMSKDDEFALDVIDWMLQHGSNLREYYEISGWVEALGELFLSGGSAWEVSAVNDSVSRLTRRAVGPVVEVLESTATSATRAHGHISVAWSKLMGRDPDPSGAYRESIRAVEAVVKPIVLPDNGLATLGQMVAALRDKPEKWTTTIGTVDGVRAQMEAVQKGQLDRHGTDDETVPLNVSQAEADAAFSACLNLVRQFVGGHVSRVTS